MSTFQICVNCDRGQPEYPCSHGRDCPRPKYSGWPDPDAPTYRPLSQAAQDAIEGGLDPSEVPPGS